MEKKNVPEVLTKSSRSESARKMWEKRRTKREPVMTERKFDWHLAFGAASIIITLGTLIFGCYFSLKGDISDLSKEIVKIETILIIKGVAPPELFASDDK